MSLDYEQWQKKRKERATIYTSSCESSSESTHVRKDKRCKVDKENSQPAIMEAKIEEMCKKLDNMATSAMIDEKLAPIMELINDTKDQFTNQMNTWKKELKAYANATVEELKGEIHDLHTVLKTQM